MRAKVFITLWFYLLGLSPVYAQERNKSQGLVSLDFHDVDISNVAKSISEITGKNFILDDRVRGKVTIISPSPVSIDEAYKVFLSALQVKNLCVVPVDANINKIVPLRECKQDQGYVEDIEQEKISGDQPITKIIPMKYISANEAKQALNPLVSKTGSIVAYGPTNSLIVSDSASNIQRLIKILQKLDKQNYQAAVEVIPLKSAQANDVAEKLNAIFEQQKKQGIGRRGNDVEGGSDVSKIIPDARTNSIIVVATREGLERTVDLLAELDRPIEIKTDQNHVHVRHLEHADAAELAGILNGLISGVAPAKKNRNDKKSSGTTSQPQAGAAGSEGIYGDEEGGFGAPPGSQAPPVSVEGNAIVKNAGGMFQDEVRIVADPATNSLVVTASPMDYQALMPVIDQLDIRRAQVFVETLIMEVNLEKVLEVGLNGHGGAQNGNYNGLAASQLNSALSPIGGFTDPKNFSELTKAGMVLGAVSKQTIKIGGISLPIQGAIFHALQTNGTINVLSAPNILTTDNMRAEIMVGQEVPFKTKTDIATSGLSQASITREKVGINLAVTPKVNLGDEVTLQIEQKIQEVEQKQTPGAADLITSERSAKTTVVAQNSQTIVIGGLIKDKEDKAVSKVPLLGDIPLIGQLFRDTKVIKTKMNLLIFLTPHVIHDPQDLTRVSVKKNNERRRFNKAQGIGENRALYDYELDKGLNMAAPPEKAKSDTKKRRFDYDQPTDQEKEDSTSGSDDDDVALNGSRRQPRRSTPRNVDYAERESALDDIAQVPRSRRPGRNRPATMRGNPFSDVRPPSSAQ